MVAMKLSRLYNEIDNGLDVPDNTRDAIGYLGCLNMARVYLRKHESQLAGMVRRLKEMREWA